MEVIARHRGVKSSAQKCRLAANLIRGKKVSTALNILSYANQKSAKIIKKVLQSAISNADHNCSVDVDGLQVKNILIDEGPKTKRIKPRAKGRANYIMKRTSHITVVVSDIC